jgi:serine/threonine protein kinase
MVRRDNAPRDLLFGLLALQNGMVTRDQLVAAFAVWTAAGDRPMADLLVEHGALTAPRRALLEGLAAEHLAAHGDDPERSLAALDLNRSTRLGLAAAGGPEVEASLAHVGSGSGSGSDGDADRTVTYAVGTATAGGQRFRVLRPHARGGLGAVFVALDGELNREVALKQILDHHADDPESRQRFVMEAEVTGGLEHPGIVPVYGLGTYADGRPYYAMRLVRGDNLKEAIGRFHKDESLRGDPGRRSLELRKLLRRFLDVCNAIEYAHSRKVLHRDIKPGNVIVGRFGETLVVDWGLAKAVGRAGSDPSSDERTLVPSSASGSAETLPGSAIGTPAYMSPEQARGDLDALGPHSDVYSLGATLYCLLTGKPPFEGDDVGEALRRVQSGAFPQPRAVDASIDRALEAVCLKAMALEPEDRYGSPRALADDVERWTADERVAAWREPFSRRARRWARRNRPAVTGAAVALLAGVVGLSGLSAVLSWANRQLKEANAATTKAKNEAVAALAETRAAKQATERALDQSKESLERAEGVLSFLKDDVLASARPGGQAGGLGVAATVRQAVDAAEPRIAARLKDQPLVEADVRDTLGVTYYYLREAPQAIRQLERTLELRRTRQGPDHPQTLDSRNNLALAYWSAGRATEAARLHEETLKLSTARLGPDHPTTLASRNNLALAYLAAGRVADAVALHEGTLRLCTSKLGADHPDTLGSRNNLALAYLAAARAGEAVRIFEETLKSFAAKLGPDHPDALQSRNNLGIAYLDAGRAGEAARLHEGTLRLRTAKLGPDHPDTLTSRGNLAAAYRAAGRVREAVALHEETFRLRTAKLGPEHPDTLSSRNNLAEAYHDAGRVADAVALHEGTLRLRTAKLGPDHPQTLTTRNNLAGTYESLGRWAEAEALRGETLARRRKTTPPDSPLLAGDLDGLGRNLLEQSKWPEAEPVLRESLAIREMKLPDDWSRFNTMSLLGGALLGRGKYAEAEPLVVPGYEGMKARAATIAAQVKHRLLEAAERVVRLYEAWGKPDTAREWKEKLGLVDLPADVFARP